MNRTAFSLVLALALLAAAGCVQAQDATAQVPAVDERAEPGTSLIDDVVPLPVDGAATGSTTPAPITTEEAATAAQPASTDDASAAPQTAPPVDATTATPQTAQPVDPRTEAEQDYDALYGASTQDYNAVADPTLPPPVELPTSYDPWEKLNRKVHRFNNVVDRTIATPLARAYVAVVPRPVRLGVGNFFNNLGQPVSAVNSLLQGKPKQAAQALGRFVVNSTIGVVGIFDPATRAHLPNHSEDFGQTLGVWGWERSRYVELPLFGPRTVRDVFGMVGDGPMAPLRGVEDDKARVFLQGLQLVDVRTQLFAVDSMREGATDEYALTRDAWMQRRRYQIFGDRQQKHDDSLPDYLREDQDNPSVPADAMPIMPTDGH
jgi:phospholipid-binding lipoprotein MlaA